MFCGRDGGIRLTVGGGGGGFFTGAQPLGRRAMGVGEETGSRPQQTTIQSIAGTNVPGIDAKRWLQFFQL